MGLFNVCDLVAHFSYDMSVKAVCVLLGETVKGVLHFEQQGAEAVQIKGEVTGLTAGNHGFHVHEFGDYSNGACRLVAISTLLTNNMVVRQLLFDMLVI